MSHQSATEKLEAVICLAQEREEKPYNQENASEEDVEIIRNTIAQIDEGIVFWYETAYQTSFSTEIQRQRVAELTCGMDSFAFVIDLTRARKPNAQTRAHLKVMFTDMKLVYSAVYTGSNIFLNIAAKFLLSSVFGEKKYQVVRERGRAIESAKEALRTARDDS